MPSLWGGSASTGSWKGAHTWRYSPSSRRRLALRRAHPWLIHKGLAGRFHVAPLASPEYIGRTLPFLWHRWYKGPLKPANPVCQGVRQEWAFLRSPRLERSSASLRFHARGRLT